MGAALARLHHQLDPQRFMLPEGGGAQLESGYAGWLDKELRSATAVVLVAEHGGRRMGYAYGRKEGRDWNSLRDACGVFVDLWVDPAARGQGAGAKLAEALMARLTALGVPRVVLMTASGNQAAQRLFARLGWRPTMVEMTREAPGPETGRR